MDDEKISGMHELLAAVEAAIQAADPAKREVLAETIDAYAEGPLGEEFFFGPRAGQAPTLLHLLLSEIDAAVGRNLNPSRGPRFDWLIAIPKEAYSRSGLFSFLRGVGKNLPLKSLAKTPRRQFVAKLQLAGV